MPDILRKTLRDQRNGLLWWFVGIVALVLITVLLYPSVGTAPEMEQLFEEMPPFAQAFIGDIADITSPEGYLNSQLFSLMIPLLFMVYCIGQGSGAIAGEESAGTMDLLLANPVPRWQVVVEKFGAMLVGGLVLGVATLVGIVVGLLFVDMETSLARLSAVTIAALLLGYLFGALAFLIGSATGKRGLSIGVSAGIGVATFLLNGFAMIISWLEPYRWLSPFHYYAANDPINNGLDPFDTLVLITLTIACLAGAITTFQRRDVQV